MSVCFAILIYYINFELCEFWSRMGLQQESDALLLGDMGKRR